MTKPTRLEKERERYYARKAAGSLIENDRRKLERRHKICEPPPPLSSEEVAALLADPRITAGLIQTIANSVPHYLIEAMIREQIIGRQGKAAVEKLVGPAIRQAIFQGDCYLRVMAQPPKQQNAT